MILSIECLLQNQFISYFASLKVSTKTAWIVLLVLKQHWLYDVILFLNQRQNVASLSGCTISHDHLFPVLRNNSLPAVEFF